MAPTLRAQQCHSDDGLDLRKDDTHCDGESERALRALRID
jgi:hypothetical protein